MIPSGVFKGRRAWHLPPPTPFPPLRCSERRFSLFLVKKFTHIMCHKADHKQVLCFQRLHYGGPCLSSVFSIFMYNFIFNFILKVIFKIVFNFIFNFVFDVISISFSISFSISISFSFQFHFDFQFRLQYHFNFVFNFIFNFDFIFI